MLDLSVGVLFTSFLTLDAAKEIRILNALKGWPRHSSGDFALSRDRSPVMNLYEF
jgi:hypothetical protein